MQRKSFLFWFVFTANLAGAFYGFVFFYGQQFLSTSPLLWLFVPDCPLMSLFFAASMLAIWKRKKLHWFYFLTFAGSLKYGFWTLFVLSYYPEYYFTPAASLTYSVLFIAHLFLFIEQFALIGRVELGKRFIPLALAFYSANEFSDYFLLTHPPLPQHSLGFMFYATLAMTFAFTFFSYLVLKRFRKPLIELF